MPSTQKLCHGLKSKKLRRIRVPLAMLQVLQATFLQWPMRCCNVARDDETGSDRPLKGKLTQASSPIKRPSFHSSLLFISILATLQTQHHSNSKSSSKPSDWICLVLLLVGPMNYPQGWSLHTSAFAALSNASQRRLGGSAATTASWIHQRA